MPTNNQEIEIERKFLLPEIPEGLTFSVNQLIYQTYLVPGTPEELRIRKIFDVDAKTHEFVLTLKQKLSGLARAEFEHSILESTYTTLLIQSGARPLTKSRNKFDLGGYHADVDTYVNVTESIEPIFDDIDTPRLRVIEVEFSSEAEANAFIPPSWFGAEITGDRRYSNIGLWRLVQM